MSIGGITGAGLQAPMRAMPAETTSTGGGPFARIFQDLVAGASAQETQANQLVHDFAIGRTENVHDVMLAVAKADLAFRMVLEIRNRLSEAFQEIMRMQV